MSELKPCPFCGEKDKLTTYFSNTGSVIVYCINCYENNNGLSHDFDGWNTRPIEDELQRRIDELEAELAALKSENVKLSKKVTDYEKELRQLHKYDNTCSTCRYLDENQNCVLGSRCVNYALWQGRIL